MPLPISINDLALDPDSNFPLGSDSPDVIDNYFRAHAAFIAKLRDEKVNSAGLRNLIINGNFSINQRAYVSGSAVGSANTYTLDRWRVVVSGQSATFTASGNGNLVTAPAGGLEQVIEGASIGGGTYVINWTGTATCTVDGTTRAKGATFTLTAGANATLRFSGGTVGEVQVEPGTVVTVFEARPIGLERMLCQRYCVVGSARWDGYATTGVAFSSAVKFPVTMRAPPTVVQASTAAVAFPTSTGMTSIGVDGYAASRTASATAAGLFAETYIATAEL